MSIAKQVESTDSNVSVEVIVSSGTTGLTGVVAIRDGSTTNSWLDFNDNTFKTAGWTTRQAALTEISATDAPGLYALSGGLDLTAVTNLPAAGVELIAEFDVSGTGFQQYAIDTYMLVTHAYDVAIAGDAMDLVTDAVDATSVANGAIDAATFAAGAIDAAAIATGAIDADALATDAVDEIVDAVWRELITDHDAIADSAAEYFQIIKGLSQDRYVLDSTVFDSAGMLTSGRIRIFDSAAQVTAATDGGSGEGETHTFTITATGSTAGQVDLYKVNR